MALKKVSNAVLIESFKKTESYAQTARDVGLSPTGVKSRILTLKAEGEDLPNVKPPGWAAKEGAKHYEEQPRQTEG